MVGGTRGPVHAILDHWLCPLSFSLKTPPVSCTLSQAEPLELTEELFFHSAQFTPSND